MHERERLAAPKSVWPERGRVEDRPWGATIAALGLGGRTGQLTLRSTTGKTHAIAFIHGAVVGATSPVSADGVPRVALRSGMVTARQVAAFVRNRRRPRADELTAFVEAMGIEPEEGRVLEQRVLLQRAARTFAIDRGEYSIEPRITIPIAVGIEVDVRALVYRGARLVLDDLRLATDLRRFGKRFILTGEIVELSRFGFTDVEQPVLQALREGTSGPELEAHRRDLDPRMVQAVIYALAACGAIRRIGALPIQPQSRAPTANELAACAPMLIRSDPMVARTATKPAAPIALGRGTRRWTEPFLEVRPTTIRPNALAAPALRALIAAGSEMLEESIDHFTMLGVPIGASVEAVRTAYVELARNLRPERLVELGLRDLECDARALLAQICIAYTALTEPARRAAYIHGLGRTAHIDFSTIAADAFRRGERALRADDPELAVAELRTACELVPDEIDYVAALARAEFSAAARRR